MCARKSVRHVKYACILFAASAAFAMRTAVLFNFDSYKRISQTREF